MIRKIVLAVLCLSSYAFGQAVGGGGVPGGNSGTSLPTATTAGQVPVATGPGTTYTAAVNTGLLNFPSLASSSTPLYLTGAFRDDMQAFFLSYSADAHNYVQLNAVPYTSFLPTGGVRDIGALYVPAQQKFYFTGTCCNNGTFWYWTTTDLQNFSSGTAITTGVGAGNTQWSPHFAQDSSGNYYLVVGGCQSSCTTATDFYIATFTPATGTFGTFNHITMNGESGTGLFDARILWNAANSTYYMVYTNQNGSQYIHIATASAIGGPYTRINSGTTDYFGFGAQSENPDIIVLPNGNIRVMADVWQTASAARWYSREYVDNQPSFAGVIGSPALINGPETEGGSNITISTPSVAALVYSAALVQPNPLNLPLGKIGINGQQNSAYSIFLNNFADSSFPNAFNGSAPTAIGFQANNGDVGVISSNASANGYLCVGIGPGDCTGGFTTPTFNGSNTWGTDAAFSDNSNNVAGFTFNNSAGSGGKIWSNYVQAATYIVYDNTDNTTPFAMIGVPTTYKNLVKIGASSQWCWDATAQYASTNTTCDTGISRTAANTIAFGNGTQGNGTANISAASFLPGVVYSAAGTALPSCVSGIKGQLAVVSDATSPTFLGTYTSGGAVASPVMCNGSNWVTY